METDSRFLSRGSVLNPVFETGLKFAILWFVYLFCQTLQAVTISQQLVVEQKQGVNV